MDKPKHSELGIASFIVSLVSGTLIILLFVIAGVLEATTPGGVDEESPQAILIGLLMIVFLGVTFVALCLGIVGLFQRNRQKIFALLGAFLSALFLVATIALTLAGMRMQ